MGAELRGGRNTFPGLALVLLSGRQTYPVLFTAGNRTAELPSAENRLEP
jgi:hypothetical protein